MKQTLTQRVEALEKRLDNKCKGWHIFTMGASKCDRCGIENPSYTAMRSTGEYCECSAGRYKDNNTCAECNKPIKPQEDVIEDIVIDLICEAWDLGYKKDGKNRHLIKKYKDKILAIVKGE